MKLISVSIFHTCPADSFCVSVNGQRRGYQAREVEEAAQARVTDQSAAIFSLGGESDLSAGVPALRLKNEPNL